MNLLDIYKELNTEEKCLTFLEHMRWPDGVKCIACESPRITRITTKGKTNKKTGKVGPDRKLYQCNECRFQFTATTGTVYHDTHLPLAKWFLAIALISESKKGISANQLSRALGVQYRTAWHLAHRIRKAMVESDPPKLKGIVEVDETYIGGKIRGRKNKLKNKEVVVGVRERGGDLRLVHTVDNSSQSLYEVIAEHVDKDAEAIMTDELPAYDVLKLSQFHDVRRGRIRHKSKIYVQGDVHTNTVESAFSLFKRGITGAFHKVSLKHLQRYLNEFSYRFNNRKSANLFGLMVRRLAVAGNLPYAKLVEEHAFTPFVRPT
jgi:transposase-like protein